MKSIFLGAIAALTFAFSSSISAQISLTDLIVKKPVPGQTVGAAYFSLANLGDSERVLVGVSSGSAESIEMHTHVHHHDMMAMEQMESVDIPANAVLKFEPGKNHLMVFSPEETAMESGVIELIFEFQDGETLSATAAVEGWQ